MKTARACHPATIRYCKKFDISMLSRCAVKSCGSLHSIATCLACLLCDDADSQKLHTSVAMYGVRLTAFLWADWRHYSGLHHMLRPLGPVLIAPRISYGQTGTLRIRRPRSPDEVSVPGQHHRAVR